MPSGMTDIMLKRVAGENPNTARLSEASNSIRKDIKVKTSKDSDQKVDDASEILSYLHNHNQIKNLLQQHNVEKGEATKDSSQTKEYIDEQTIKTIENNTDTYNILRTKYLSLEFLPTLFAPSMFIVYACVFSSFTNPIQLFLFGTQLFGSVILSQIAFGVIAAAILTPIAIIFCKSLLFIEEDNTYTILFFIPSLITCILCSPAIETIIFGQILFSSILLLKIIFGTVCASLMTFIAHNLPLSIKDFLLNIVLLPTGLPILTSLFCAKYPSCQKFMPYSYSAEAIASVVFDCRDAVLFFAIVLSVFMCFKYYIPIIFTESDIELYVIGIISAPIFKAALETISLISNMLEEHITTPFLSLDTIQNSLLFFKRHVIEDTGTFINNIITKIYNVANNINGLYREYTIEKLDTSKTDIMFVDYIVLRTTNILQAAIDSILFPIFITLYLHYKAAELLTDNAKKTAQKRPIITVIFFTITATLCAIFASPIQLFVFGHIAMASSPIMNIMFGTMSGLASTLFATNAYVTTNKYAKPFLASAFETSCKTFSSLHASMTSCFGSTKNNDPKNSV